MTIPTLQATRQNTVIHWIKVDSCMFNACSLNLILMKCFLEFIHKVCLNARMDKSLNTICTEWCYPNKQIRTEGKRDTKFL